MANKDQTFYNRYYVNYQEIIPPPGNHFKISRDVFDRIYQMTTKEYVACRFASFITKDPILSQGDDAFSRAPLEEETNWFLIDGGVLRVTKSRKYGTPSLIDTFGNSTEKADELARKFDLPIKS